MLMINLHFDISFNIISFVKLYLHKLNEIFRVRKETCKSRLLSG